jgi:hypothetical protein
MMGNCPHVSPDGTFSGVGAIACGGWHSAALTTTGDLYAWGWSKHGQLGEAGNLSPAPRLMTHPALDGADDVLVQVSGNLTRCLLAHGDEILGWGVCRIMPGDRRASLHGGGVSRQGVVDLGAAESLLARLWGDHERGSA